MNYTAQTTRQLGQILRGQRKSQKWTQESVGASVGLLPKTVSKLELATESATIESLFKLLSALELEMVIRSKGDSPRSGDW
jgi:HTH-type transcriptional regulator/antitoxin HipB